MADVMIKPESHFIERLTQVQMKLVQSLRTGRSHFAHSIPLLEHLLAAALMSDGPSLEGAIDRLMTEKTEDPDLVFLADWAGFWVFGPTWRTPLLSIEPNVESWKADARWIEAHRRIEEQATRERLGTVPLTTGPGPLLVAAKLNGREGRFILDTGAPGSVVTSAYAESVGLEPAGPERTVYDGSGRPATLVPAVVERVSLGSWSGTNLAMDILDLTESLGVDGILSPFDLFRDLALTFDITNGNLQIGDLALPPSRGIVRPAYWSEGVVSLNISVDNTPLLCLVDTGAGGFVLMDDAAARVGIKKGCERRQSTVTAFGSVEIVKSRFARIEVPGLGVSEEQVYIKPRPPERVRPLPCLVDGYLGRPWLDHTVLHFPSRRGSVILASMEGAEL